MDAGEIADVRQTLRDRKGRLEAALEEHPRRADLGKLLREVDAALDRFEAGTYGLCETCHDPIEPERLQVDPLTRNCLDHLSSGEQRALERDLDLAFEVQQKLLPRRGLSLLGWNSAFVFAPAGPVSGDYCDLIPDAQGEALYFFLGDVSGKGVAASLLMVHLNATFRTLVAASPPLPKLLEQANRLFCEGTLSHHYATLVCGRAFADGRVEVSNAGHCRPLLLRRRGIETIDSHGLPLGMFCASQYGSTRLQLSQGESLVLVTDGIVEALNQEGSEYGEERLIRLLAGQSGLSSKQLAEICFEDSRRFRRGLPKQDDHSILVLGYGTEAG